MTTPLTSAHRPRTCRACGKKFEYPVKGSAATRHHCAECAVLAEDTRLILERLQNRIAALERQVNRLTPPAPKPPVG
jgi:alkylation response protein AidB-like acyl-CoA dehydrogenase